jgi:hypothetical protein
MKTEARAIVRFDSSGDKKPSSDLGITFNNLFFTEIISTQSHIHECSLARCKRAQSKIFYLNFIIQIESNEEDYEQG